ncbi:uncharacterized [Tachysurus ichikawai]
MGPFLAAPHTSITKYTKPGHELTADGKGMFAGHEGLLHSAHSQVVQRQHVFLLLLLRGKITHSAEVTGRAGVSGNGLDYTVNNDAAEKSPRRREAKTAGYRSEMCHVKTGYSTTATRKMRGDSRTEASQRQERDKTDNGALVCVSLPSLFPNVGKPVRDGGKEGDYFYLVYFLIFHLLLRKSEPARIGLSDRVGRKK